MRRWANGARKDYCQLIKHVVIRFEPIDRPAPGEESTTPEIDMRRISDKEHIITFRGKLADECTCTLEAAFETCSALIPGIDLTRFAMQFEENLVSGYPDTTWMAKTMCGTCGKLRR